MIQEIELSQLDLRYEGFRMKNPGLEARSTPSEDFHLTDSVRSQAHCCGSQTSQTRAPGEAPPSFNHTRSRMV